MMENKNIQILLYKKGLKQMIKLLPNLDDIGKKELTLIIDRYKLELRNYEVKLNELIPTDRELTRISGGNKNTIKSKFIKYVFDEIDNDILECVNYEKTGCYNMPLYMKYLNNYVTEELYSMLGKTTFCKTVIQSKIELIRLNWYNSNNINERSFHNTTQTLISTIVRSEFFNQNKKELNNLITKIKKQYEDEYKSINKRITKSCI